MSIISRLAAAVLLIGAALASEPAVAQQRCAGKDIMAELARTDPAMLARIRAEARATDNGEALLWRVEKAGVAPSYLFGTAHLTDERVHALPEQVRKAFAEAGTVALELANPGDDGVAKEVASFAGLLVFADGRSLKGLLPADEFAQLRGIAGRVGVPADSVERLKPWFATTLLALPACELRRAASGLASLDARLAADARAQGKPVIGLETVREQLLSMSSVPDADQVTALRASLKMNGRIEDLLETLVLMYVERRIAELWPLNIALSEKAGFAARSFESFTVKVVTERNRLMAARAAPLLAKGGAFIGVGALHLSGKEGLVALVRGQGYTVTRGE